MASNNAGSGAELSDNGGDGQTEISDAQVVENSPHPSEAVESLATFTASHGPLDLKVLPNVERGGTDWRIVVYSRGVRGPLLETNRPITDQQASELGISRQLQDRLNEALEYAQSELELPRELGHMTRSKQSLSDLEALMD